MNNNLPKVELKFIELTPQRLQGIRPTKALDIRTGNDSGFHEDGLFSTLTFGEVGSKERDTTFSYIDIHTNVIHPIYYRELIRLKSLYKDVIERKKYAIFDEELKDLVVSDPINGQTGYSFFLSVLPKIEFKRNGSRRRDASIDIIEKYRDSYLYNKILVQPAGLRDIMVDEQGRDKEGEINDFYRRIIGASNSIGSQADLNSALLDTSRVSIQNSFNGIVQYITNLIRGKGGFIAGKWGKRGVTSGTRSVITSISTARPDLDGKNGIAFNQTAVGIFQACKSYQPQTIHAVLNITNHWFSQTGAYLTDKNTLEATNANLSSDDIDQWTTPSGISKILDNFEDVHFRTRPIEVGDKYYLCLVWKGEVHGKPCYKIVKGKEDVPEHMGGEVTPLTYVELLYLARLEEWEKDIYFITRYPVAGAGSTYPSLCYIRTTAVSENRFRLGEDWQPTDVEARAYPVLKDATFMDSLSVHPSRLPGLGGDHDGDKVSSLSLMSEEARQEVYDYLNTPNAYVTGHGQLLANPYMDAIERVLKNTTGLYQPWFYLILSIENGAYALSRT